MIIHDSHGRFVKGHKLLLGSEKGWFKKGHFLGKRFTSKYSPGVKFRKGQTPWNKGIKTGVIPWNKELHIYTGGGFKKGHILTEEQKQKISKALKGRIPKNLEEARKKALENHVKGKKHPFWKGNNVSYSGLHHWIKRELGKPKICENCKTDEKIQWANKSHEYKRDLSDWLSLCIKCHRKYDKEYKLNGTRTNFVRGYYPRSFKPCN